MTVARDRCNILKRTAEGPLEPVRICTMYAMGSEGIEEAPFAVWGALPSRKHEPSTFPPSPSLPPLPQLQNEPTLGQSSHPVRSLLPRPPPAPHFSYRLQLELVLGAVQILLELADRRVAAYDRFVFVFPLLPVCVRWWVVGGWGGVGGRNV